MVSRDPPFNYWYFSNSQRYPANLHNSSVKKNFQLFLRNRFISRHFLSLSLLDKSAVNFIEKELKFIDFQRKKPQHFQKGAVFLELEDHFVLCRQPLRFIILYLFWTVWLLLFNSCRMATEISKLSKTVDPPVLASQFIQVINQSIN